MPRKRHAPGSDFSCASLGSLLRSAMLAPDPHGSAPRATDALEMDNPRPEPQIVERNPDGSFTKETLQRAIKALKKRLKATRLDDESRLGHDAMTRGGRSGIVGVALPKQYPPEVWQELVEKGRIREVGRGSGTFEIVEQSPNQD